MGSTRGKESGILLAAQVICIVLFGVFVEYDPAIAPRSNSTEAKTLSDETTSEFNSLYPFFQDVHVIVVIGIGLLLTFLKRYAYGSVAFNFLLTCYVIEWSVLVNGWFALIGKPHQTKIYINTKSLLDADFAAATVLISFCTVLGVTSPTQLTIMATIEVVFYNLSFYVGVGIMEVVDVGGSMFVHGFSAFFGVAVARVLYKEAQTKSDKEGSTYHSDITAMIGTLFLWLYWPSFNGSPAVGVGRQRAVVNTVLSLAGCVVTTFAISALINKKGKFEMVHVQNASLAGGVAMGACADLILNPFGALLLGSAASVVSCLGYSYVQPFLTKRKLHDSCGVFNLHALPGILGAVASAIVISMATPEVYQDSYPMVVRGGRTPAVQAGYQIGGLVVSSSVALVGGLVTGLLLKIPIWDNVQSHELFEDATFWKMHEEESDEFSVVEKVEMKQ